MFFFYSACIYDLTLKSFSAVFYIVWCFSILVSKKIFSIDVKCHNQNT